MGKLGWARLSKDIRRVINKCQWCKKHRLKTKQGVLHCHHIGTRGHGNNPEYRLCPMNLIVVCQECHEMLEPFAKVRVQLTLYDELGKEVEPVACCQRGFLCPRWREQFKCTQPKT